MPEEVVVNLGEATPRRLLVDWANGQDAWVRQLTAETILSRRAPTSDLLDSVYETFLSEKGLSDTDTPSVPKLQVQEAETTKDETLELASLSNVQSVNALASDQRLEFDPRLTILFGQNGSGKTGYARIIKRISAVRSPEDILPNAHVAHLDPPPPPSAEITYMVGGEGRTTRWENEAGLVPFTRISVFDADAVSLHVDRDLGYVYTPAELALFGHVAAGLQGVQQRISSEVTNLASGSNPLLSKFARETKVYPLVETLGAATDLSELEAAAKVDDDAEAIHERLTTEVHALRSNTLDALLANAQQSERELRRLSALVSAVQGFSTPRYEQAVAAVADAEDQRAEAREQLFTVDELHGPPDEQWQHFVAAGDTYREHLGRKHYPQEGDSCLYCMQRLSPTAIALLGRYRTFLDETLVRQLGAARASLASARLTLVESELSRANEYLTDQARGDGAPGWVAKAMELLGDAKATVAETATGQTLSHTDLASEASRIALELGAALGAVVKQVEQFASDRENAATTLAAKQKELAELGARMELKKNLPTAREYVRRAKRAQQLEKLSKTISSGAAKTLTIQSKLASEDLVNKNFETLFAEECARLNAPKVALHFQGRSGQAQRKKVVAHYRPSAVLSEGEQKVLALADFLAESRMRGIKAPLVFDDPVTSLDYRRLDEVAARIQHLAETHQVIVLTHNIMFASALISSRQNKKLRVKIYEVRDGGAHKGILAPDVEPQLDTPADLTKRINVKLQDMPKAEAVVQDALIKEAYDLLRAWCEAFVEQELLQNVTQRYRHNIMMTRLSKIDAARLGAATAVIEPLFARACDRMTGHSHAAERMSTKPTVAEFEEDWERAKAARSAYLAQ
ncbi:AAA family ATPase [Propioniciclava sp. MC1595]|uniref:AAA family ATPase n=1 Tax=Propioniciclava sp. MC1595 TaxID=2760308 RepID=UPI0016627415|nr:ATP-binding protein [Propioniciclava sp. MC1595]MBB1495463.1 AAA family ATPase [Propioniciclava sp. MC1595]QTE26626.1 AAA family ATPase [Propioniciclava sp. MC1595]